MQNSKEITFLPILEFIYLYILSSLESTANSTHNENNRYTYCSVQYTIRTDMLKSLLSCFFLAFAG